MFLDQNFRRLGKVNSYLPPFGFRTQGKKGSFHHLPATTDIFNNFFMDGAHKNINTRKMFALLCRYACVVADTESVFSVLLFL